MVMSLPRPQPHYGQLCCYPSPHTHTHTQLDSQPEQILPDFMSRRNGTLVANRMVGTGGLACIR